MFSELCVKCGIVALRLSSCTPAIPGIALNPQPITPSAALVSGGMPTIDNA